METAQESGIPRIILVSLSFLIVILLGFNLALSRYGAFWKKPQPKVPVTPEPQQQVEFKIGCPVPQEYCQDGKEFRWEGEVIGISFVLPEETPLLAAFDGEPKKGAGTNAEGVSSEILFLISKDGYEAAYFFQGEKQPLPFAVKKGEILSRVSRESISPSQEINLLFTVKKQGTLLPISRNSFQ